MTADLPTRRVWRVRAWVRAVAVALPVLFLSTVIWPSAFNPTWTDGLPADQWPPLAIFYAAFAVCIYCAFRSRIELENDRLLIVNPWGVSRLSVAAVTEVGQGSWGVEFLRLGRRVAVGFAVQGVRCADVAQAVTGRWPAWALNEDDELFED